MAPEERVEADLLIDEVHELPDLLVLDHAASAGLRSTETLDRQAIQAQPADR
jgi:hypothetical protein